MAKDPAFLFYPNDWIGGTMGMTLEEKGAYMEVLMMQFNRGHMTEHMIGLTIGHLFGRIKDKFIQDSDGLWYNERLEVEKEKRKKFVDSRHNNSSGENQYSKKKKKNIGHMTDHMENENNVLKVKQEKENEEVFKPSGNYRSQGEELYAFKVAQGRRKLLQIQNGGKPDL